MSISGRVSPFVVPLAILGFVFAHTGSSHAQTVAALQDKLSSASSIACEFPLVAVGTWTKEGEPQATVKPAEKLSVRFDAIKADEGSAEMFGSFGKFDIVVRFSEGTLHLIQMFRAGPLYVTTVFPRVSRAGKLVAAHSRHEYTEVSLPGFTSRPEQYYGECEVR